MQDKTNIDEATIDETTAAEQDRADVPLEGESGGANLRAPNRGQLAFASIAALLCIVLIGGSAWALVSGGALPLGAGVQGEGSSIRAASSSVDGESADKNGEDGSSSEAGGDSESSANAVSGDRRGGADAQAASSAGADGNAASNPGQKPGSDSSSSTGGGSGAANGPAGNQGSPAPAPSTITVTISADGSVGGGGAAGPITLTFEEGATVYDALAGAGWSVLADWGAFGAYVTSINGVAAGPNTGWTYTVNGSQPNYACSSYTLSDGDVIRWTFVEVK